MKIQDLLLKITTIGLVCSVSSVIASNINTAGQKGVSRTVTTYQYEQGTYNLGASFWGAYAYEGIYDYSNGGAMEKDSPRLFSEDLFFGIGLTNWADLSLDMPFYQDQWEDHDKAYGIGDLGVSMKLAHVGLDKNAPFRVAYLGRFTFPTGSKNTGYYSRQSYYSYRENAVQYGRHPYGAGGVRFQPQMVWTLDFSKFPSRHPVALHANIGPNIYLATKKQAYEGSSAGLVGSLALEFSPGEKYSFYSELSGDLLFAHLEEGTNPFTDLNENNLVFTLGMTRRTQAGLKYDIGVDVGLSDWDSRIVLVNNNNGQPEKYSISGAPMVAAKFTLSYEHRGEKARYALGRFFGSPEDTVRIVDTIVETVTKFDTVKVVENDTIITVQRDTIRIKETQDRGNIIQYGVVVFRNLNFRVGSASLLPSSYPVLDDIAASMQKFAEVKIEVRGYTDVSGNAEKNLLLSQQRAQSVVDYLVSRGIASERLKAIGLGNSEPIADNSTSEGRVLNRRVEIKRVDSF